MKSRNFSKFSRQALDFAPNSDFISAEPTMTRSRLVSTVASILTGLGAFYCSLFYLPAYLNQSDVVRISSYQRVSASLKENDQGTPVNWYTPYIDLLRARRGFFRAGQTIEVEYVLSGPDNLNIEIKRCAGPIIYEIFRCHVIDQINHTENESSQGRLLIKAPSTGFYRMTENVTEKTASSKASNTSIQYSVIWRRK